MKTSAFLLVALAQSAFSTNTYNLRTTVPWAPTQPRSVDQSLVLDHVYYLSDRSNAGVHVVSLLNTSQITLVDGFSTTKKNGTIISSASGPNGVIALPDRNEVWAGDAAGIVRVISTKTYKVIANISTGSVNRADEFAYDPTSGIIIASNPDETPPYVSVINASNRTVMGRITFDDATDGIEQPAFDPASNEFYVSVPGTTSLPGGAIQTLSLKNMSIARTIPLPDCKPAGIVFGPNSNLFVSCSEDQIADFDFAASYVINSLTGAVIANISGVAGVDQVTYSNKTNMYYASAYLMLAGGREDGMPAPILAIIDADANKLMQTITTDNVTAHSVAVDSSTGDVAVPIQATGIKVYSLASGNNTLPVTAAAGLTLPGLKFCVGVSLLAVFSQLV